MNELLIVFFILLISVLMFFSIMAILKADKKVLELNENVSKFKETDFSNLKKTVNSLNSFNKYVKLGKIRRYFEIIMTSITSVNLIVVLKKLYTKDSAKKISD